MTYANAGHEPPVVRHAGGAVEELDSSSMVLGVLADCQYSEASYGTGPGDMVVIVTDGITEARSGVSFFGKEGVLRYMSENREVALEDIPSGLLETARAFAGGQLRDDVAIVAFQCCSAKA